MTDISQSFWVQLVNGPIKSLSLTLLHDGSTTMMDTISQQSCKYLGSQWIDWVLASSAMHQSPRRSILMAADCFYYCLGYGFLKQVAHLIQRHTLKKKEQKKVSGSIPHASRVSLYFLVLKTKLYILQHFLQHAQFAGCTLSTYSHTLYWCSLYWCALYTVPGTAAHCTHCTHWSRLNRLNWIDWVESIWVTWIHWIMLVHQSNHSNRLNLTLLHDGSATSSRHNKPAEL